MFEIFIHRWLRRPYTLHVSHHRKVRRPNATVLFLHGIGESGKAWNKIISELPEDVAALSVDLLGFGQSPRPSWAIYDTTTQARTIAATLRKKHLRSTSLIVVGHSLGGLIAIELAKQYPRTVRSLLLCSPPLYHPEEKDKKRFLMRHDDRLRKLYRMIQNNPRKFVLISNLAMKAGVLGKGVTINKDTIATYIDTLEASIVNQDVLKHAETLEQKTTIIYGKLLDPVVIYANLKHLAGINPRITLKVIAAGHQIRGRYATAIINEIKHMITSSNT